VFLTLAVGWVGYTLAYFGFCSLKGPGVGLLDLVIPGRTVVIPSSSSSSSPGFSEGFPKGTTIGPTAPDGSRVITPGDGGTPYKLVPVGGGNYSTEPLPPGQSITGPGPLPGGLWGA
jgi:hypothetical protein